MNIGFENDIVKYGRSTLEYKNFFEQRFIEISSSGLIILRTYDDVFELRACIEHNILQWHSDYCVVFDCSNITIATSAGEEFDKIQRYFRAFFCRGFFGYSVCAEQHFPFRVFRTREAALEAVSVLMGLAMDPYLSSLARSSEFPLPRR